jgi:hypothetical protein
MEFKTKVQGGDLNLEVINMSMILKARRLDETIKRVNGDQRMKRCSD